MTKFFSRKLVASLCGTFLKPEMQSVYRQIAGLERFRTVVFTEKRSHEASFPFEDVVVMRKPPPEVRVKLRKKRQRGNFIRRFYYKHLLKQWPPPERPKPLAPPPPTPVINPELLEPYDLVALLRTHRVDLAHVYYGHKASKYLGMLRRWGGPFVVSFHGLDVTEAVYKPGQGAPLPEVFARASLVLARSESLLARLTELGCPPEKLRLNRASIPVAGIPHAVRRAPEDGRWIFLQACRLIPKKGIATTLLALQRVVAEHPATQLILAGNGPLEPELRRQADELRLTGNVLFAGWCSQRDLLDLYARAHVFLHPSETTATGDREGVPNSLLEAMAAGLPIVATRHGGIPEAVSDGCEGLLVPERSPDELAQALLTLMEQPSRLEALSANAPVSVAEKFGIAGRIRALEDCYAEALGLPG